jgi:predicted  nucleic acid-binding Zn-ribbon protein
VVKEVSPQSSEKSPLTAAEQRVSDRMQRGTTWIVLTLGLTMILSQAALTGYRAHELGVEMTSDFQVQLNRTLRMIAKEFGSRAPSLRQLAYVSQNLVARSDNILRADIVDDQGRGLRAFFREGDEVKSVGWIPVARQTKFVKVREAMDEGSVKAHTFRIISMSRHRFALKLQVLFLGSTGGSLSRRGVLITFRYKTSPILNEPFSSIRKLALKNQRPTLVAYTGAREGYKELAAQMNVLGFTHSFPLKLFRFDEKTNPTLRVSYHLPSVGWWFLGDLIIPFSFLVLFYLMIRLFSASLVRKVFRELSTGAPMAAGQLKELSRLASSIDFQKMSGLALELPARASEAADDLKKMREELASAGRQLDAVEKQMGAVEQVQTKTAQDPEKLKARKARAQELIEAMKFELNRTEQSLSSFAAFEDIVVVVGKRLSSLSSESTKSADLAKMTKWMHRLEDLTRTASRTAKLQVGRLQEAGTALDQWSMSAADDLNSQSKALDSWDVAAVALRGEVRKLRVDYDHLDQRLANAQKSMLELSDRMKKQGSLGGLAKDLKGLGTDLATMKSRANKAA